MSLIKAAGSGEVSTGFYTHLLDQSLKFDSSRSTVLTRTATTPTNGKKATWSWWMKKCDVVSDTSVSYKSVFYSGTQNSDGFSIAFMRYGTSRNHELIVKQDNGSSASHMFILTDAFYRDVSSWYHFVVRYDSTDSTANDRIKIYVNGTEQTINRTGTDIEPPLNHIPSFQVSGKTLRIGEGRPDVSGEHIDAYLAEINFIDGQALDPSSFGETKDGIWIPIDTSGLTFGDNGFHLTFKDDVVSEGFNTVTYTGTAANQSLSGLGFSPAFVWVKVRDGTNNHRLFDVVRGATKDLISNSTSTESTTSTRLQSFDGDGFTVGSNAEVNASGGDIVAWCWEAGGAPTADNSAGAGATPTAGSVKIDGSNLGSALAGSIAATRLSADTARGFSIGTFTKGSGTETVAHGLGAAPDWLIVKRTNGTGSWAVYHSAYTANPETDYLRLNSTNGTADDATFWGDTAPTSTVFSIGAAFNSGEELVFYAWTEISDYSKFGSYTGNGGSNNAVTGLGFKPAWLMVKRTDTATTYSNWWIQDGTRNPTNVGNTLNIAADTAGAETNALEIDFDSDGFTLQDGSQGSNISGGTYIYMAFADTREAAFFKDVSTNGNHWTPVNLDYRDSVPDTPTNNWCTLNPALSDSHFNTDQLSEGNLSYNEGEGNNGDGHPTATFSVISGKWYWEYRMVSSGTSGSAVGWANERVNSEPELGYNSPSSPSGAQIVYVYLSNSPMQIISDAPKSSSSGGNLSANAIAQDDIIGVAADFDNDKWYFSINGSFTNMRSSQNPATGTNPLCSASGGGGLVTIARTAGLTWYPAIGNWSAGSRTSVVNFGQDSTFGGGVSAGGNADGNGFGDFFCTIRIFSYVFS